MSVQAIYRYIIDDVIRALKNEDPDNQLDESVLIELQNMWEARLENSGAIPHLLGDNHHSSLNMNNNNNTNVQQYQQTNQLQPTSMPLPSPINMPRQNENDLNRNGVHPLPLRPVVTTANTDNNLNLIRGGIQQQHQQQHQQYNNTNIPPFREVVNNNNTYNLINNLNQNPISSASLRSIMNPIPQNDGVNDDEEEINVNSTKQDIDKYLCKSIKKETNFIVQMDGNDEDDEDNEDFDDAEINKEIQNDDLLNSDLDDDDDDDDPDPVIEHYVLCQYEKVTRIKTKRKCVFKDGVMHLNGKDSLFNKATGEFMWI